MKPSEEKGLSIAVVGGGPAGSFFTCWVHKFAAQAGRRVEVTLFEGRDFSVSGPRGCNKCAGILSSRLQHGMRDLGLTVPARLVMSPIHSYILHLHGESVEITQPNQDRQILSVYRGSGPRLGELTRRVSFDAFLLDEAVRCGARLRRARVRRVDLSAGPTVHTADGTESFDLVVVATGVNARSVIAPELGYVPPATEVMAQDELLLPADTRHGIQRTGVHVFGDAIPGLVFAGFVPKGDFVNVSVLGHYLPADSVGLLLASPAVCERVPPEAQRLCGCAPRVAVSAAEGYYADGLVVIGDACVSRLYKDGIGSALVTARQAAWTVVLHGMTAQAFAAHYAPLCRDIDRDNRFGRLLLEIWARMKRSRRASRAWIVGVRAEHRLPPGRRPLNRILWALFTGDESYRSILARLLTWRAQLHWWSAYFRGK